MKNVTTFIINHLAKYRRVGIHAAGVMLLVVCGLWLLPTEAQANDYLEKEKHYMAYTSGSDRIHFKVPIWAYGWWNDYLIMPVSTLSYRLKGSSEKVLIANFCAHPFEDNTESNKKGTGRMRLENNGGQIFVTSMASGVNQEIPGTGNWAPWLTLVQKEDDDSKRVTFLEFDWYPPAELDGQNFYVDIHLEIACKCWYDHIRVHSLDRDDNFNEWKDLFSEFSDVPYKLDLKYGPFAGRNNPVTPQLFTPYLYQLNEEGLTGYGYAAVSYSVFDEPASYKTSLDTDWTDMDGEKRVGNFYVMTNDTVQEQFYADIAVWRNKETGTYDTLRTIKMDIPPYHRIYDFLAVEETDSTGTFTGDNILKWSIINPKLKDIVDGDYFEIQRATDSTFSDATQLAVIQMRRDSVGLYKYRDDSRSIWTGHNTEDTISQIVKQTVENYILSDFNGQPAYNLDVRLETDKVIFPSKPVYYRIRRASASVWDWDPAFMQSVSLTKNNFLAPLSATQPDYTKDADYENNRKVNFRFILENRMVQNEVPAKDQFQLRYTKTRTLKEQVTVRTDLTNTSNENVAYIQILSPDGTEIVSQYLATPHDFAVPIGSTIWVSYVYMRGLIRPSMRHSNFTAGEDCLLHFEPNSNSTVEHVSQQPYSVPGAGVEDYLTDTIRRHLTDSLYNEFVAQFERKSYGKCMWDRTAGLVLIRTVEETGKSQDIYIPQDSIRRREDGNWEVHFSDIADQACAHYRYAVRIDQSRSDLRVQKPATQLQPVPINGPELYFDEGADIRSFTATQGDTRTELKPGVLLQWQPSSTAVDEYIVRRWRENSDVRDTIYTGVETSYFDTGAEPDVHYVYEVNVLYNCNGKATRHFAQTTGWRTAFGEIRGRIVMTNNSSMAGVTVTLTGDGLPEAGLQHVTGADGSFVFDSLRYDLVSGTDYAIVPSHTYAQFSFNASSAPTASIGLSAANPVATGIDFVNTSSVRITGRVLYENSTIPVAGAMFILNGDTVMRGTLPLTTAIDGTFEIMVTQSQPNRLQVFKPGHVFAGDGKLHVEGDSEDFALTAALDGIRFYDQTKVRLVGRVAGGNDQRDLPEAFGLGKNNLGEDLQLVLQLEGDNVSQIVHDPNDLTRDTVIQEVASTYSIFEKKRIVIRPDQATGEYQIDLFPVKYKVTQATARGYATLFAAGQGNEVVDLTNAPLNLIKTYYEGDSAVYNAIYDRIYHSPVQVELRQNLYGIERRAYGEPEMEINGIDPNKSQSIDLYFMDEDKQVHYTLGHPVFYANRKYQFKAKAYEAYSYNNDPTNETDTVPQRGGRVIVRNGLHNATSTETYNLDEYGENNAIWLMVDNVDVEHAGTAPMRNVSVALETEGNVVETNVFSAYVTGLVVEEKTLRSTDASIQLLDIVRDPGGAGSSAYIESGATYDFSFTTSLKLELGAILSPTWGHNISQYIGIYSGTPAGSYIGQLVQTNKAFSFNIPITYKIDYGTGYYYSMTTNERITTSSAQTPTGVGRNADVFFGVTIAQITGKAKTISIISDSLYQMCAPSFNSGAMLELASGIGTDGRPYHLVTGRKIVVGPAISNTFVYTQKYVLETLIPRLALDRQNLLMSFPDSATAKQTANAMGHEVYWYYETGNYLNDTIPLHAYKMITPDDDKIYIDQVAVLNNSVMRWLEIVKLNEREKVEARIKGQKIGTYSLSTGATYSHSDNYSTAFSYNEFPQNMAITSSLLSGFGGAAASAIGSYFAGIVNTTAYDALQKLFFEAAKEPIIGMDEDGNMFMDEGSPQRQKNLEEVGAQVNNTEFHMEYDKVFNINSDKRRTSTGKITKTEGFTIVPDPLGEISVSVYRAEFDSTWKADSQQALEQVAQQGNSQTLLYGSYVYYTEGGATMCPHEGVEKTMLFNPGTDLGNGTEWVGKPELTADTYEMANIAPDKRATFRIHLYNQGQVDSGPAADGTGFYLYLDGSSNPDGAKVYINGAPLNQSLYFWIAPGAPVTQTLEVERGTVDDYNLTIGMYVDGCAKTRTTMNLGVHFLPLSTDVEIAMPRQNWVMNTLSPQDSTGYYLPVSIEGFDIHHKNFDHIEFQYKLSTQSDDDWVNQCSFYAEDSLYALATGNKAMIENGRITPFRFYGERDPMEQHYDLRAVSFCRFGSGFVTKASPVISGTKDTRPPRVFGDPEPSNAILGVGEHLLLRFNEPIAGNYLDEDNNFQLLGVTNTTGITAATALHFDFATTAVTKVKRDLTNKSFTMDMMIRPSDANRKEDVVLFMFGNNDAMRSFVLTPDNRLQIITTDGVTHHVSTSKPIGTLLEFTRVLFVYDKDLQHYRFYAGTTDLTDTTSGETDAALPTGSAELRFGGNYKGDMLEVRLWSKALTLEEIGATANRYLTGYEQELLAYYRMNEGKGETVTDRAHGATLYLNGCSWNRQKGYSVHLTPTDSIRLNGNLFSRSKVYDATHMFWFKTATASSERANLFASGRTDDKHGTLIALENGQIVLCSDSLSWTGTGTYADDKWHHVVLSVNRTYNNAALFVDGSLIHSFPATMAAATTGAMYLGGNFTGYLDEFAVFEQAMPNHLIEAYDNIALAGDEMGLIAYLPFEEQFLNPNGILEQRFSVNDRRQYKDPITGEVINKTVPLVQGDVSALADNSLNAPVSSHGLLTKLHFDWSFNQDELMINVLNQDSEVNKQTVYITVRDVEDLNGNPMHSPVTWVAFVDRNTLKWEDDEMGITYIDGTDLGNANYVDFRIVNHSGKRHQYTIESLPDWLTTSERYGSINPMDDKTIRLYYDTDMAVGEYSDIVYLTDENGLSEPLEVTYSVTAVCPYDEPDKTRYPLNMSVCGQVMIDNTYDSDSQDKVIVLFRNACVGMTNVDFDDERNTAKVFLTVYGSAAMENKSLTFVLWQASTGKVLNLVPSREIQFSHGAVYGCGDDQPVIFTAGGSETQNIPLPGGWTWISTYLNLRPANAPLNSVMTASDPWREGDLIKNPDLEQFSTYSQVMDVFMGSLAAWDYSQIYMVYSANSNTLRLNGDKLPDVDKHLTLIGNGHWNPFPCLFMQTTPVEEALADYYDHATQGDLIKSHDHFAVFSADGHWEGNLTALRPGEGYLFRRLAADTVDIHFYNKPANSPSRVETFEAAFHSTTDTDFSNPSAATNMTMIAKLVSPPKQGEPERVFAFIGDDLVGIAEPLSPPLRGSRRGSSGEPEEALYFLTIQSDKPGTLRFTTADGQELSIVNLPQLSINRPIVNRPIVNYEADTHLGTPESPVLLTPVDDRPYKILENNHIVIIKNNEKYDVTGKKLH